VAQIVDQRSVRRRRHRVDRGSMAARHQGNASRSSVPAGPLPGQPDPHGPAAGSSRCNARSAPPQRTPHDSHRTDRTSKHRKPSAITANAAIPAIATHLRSNVDAMERCAGSLRQSGATAAGLLRHARPDQPPPARPAGNRSQTGPQASRRTPERWAAADFSRRRRIGPRRRGRRAPGAPPTELRHPASYAPACPPAPHTPRLSASATAVPGTRSRSQARAESRRHHQSPPGPGQNSPGSTTYECDIAAITRASCATEQEDMLWDGPPIVSRAQGRAVAARPADSPSRADRPTPPPAASGAATQRRRIALHPVKAPPTARLRCGRSPPCSRELMRPAPRVRPAPRRITNRVPRSSGLTQPGPTVGRC